MNEIDELFVNIALFSSFFMFADVRSFKNMVALVNNRCAHAHDKSERVTKTEETLAAVTSVQEAEHHDAARLGEGALTVT